MKYFRKCFFLCILFVLSKLALAGSTCNDIQGKQNHSPLKTKVGEVCFIEQPLLDANGKAFADAIKIFFIPYGVEPVEAKGRGLLYDEDPGKIIDAFMLDINHDGNDELIIIHFINVRPSLVPLNTSGKFYSVYVFNQDGANLTFNEHASEWFGSAYSKESDNHKIIYTYPYQTQQSIRRIISSPFSVLMIRDETIPVIVRRKSKLYESPAGDTITKKYLISGDKGSVDKHQAGLSRINYAGGKKPLQMWIMCDALELDAG